jgi:uncharacterized protein (UPF0276 family)
MTSQLSLALHPRRLPLGAEEKIKFTKVRALEDLCISLRPSVLVVHILGCGENTPSVSRLPLQMSSEALFYRAKNGSQV